MEARRAAWSRSGPGGGSEVRLRPSPVSCARAPYLTARPALLARGAHIPGAGQLGGGTGSPEATDPRMQLRRKARPVGYSQQKEKAEHEFYFICTFKPSKCVEFKQIAKTMVP